MFLKRELRICGAYQSYQPHNTSPTTLTKFVESPTTSTSNLRYVDAEDNDSFTCAKAALQQSQLIRAQNSSHPQLYCRIKQGQKCFYMCIVCMGCMGGVDKAHAAEWARQILIFAVCCSLEFLPAAWQLRTLE